MAERKKEQSLKRRRLIMVGKILITVVILCLLLVGINFIPTWKLETRGMHRLEGSWVDVYYEEEELAARDVFLLADAQTEYVAKKLGFSEKQDVNIYIYDSQSTMQTKKYGYLGPLLGLDWYIGDNIGTNVILTSPANPGRMHDYDSIKNAVVHEVVHAYVSVMNPDIRLWLTEGMALYLANGEPFDREYFSYMEIPTYAETCTWNPITFSNSGGYTFAHTYIEFLNEMYGWEAVLQLIETEDYKGIFGKTDQELYAEWVTFLEHYGE